MKTNPTKKQTVIKPAASPATAKKAQAPKTLKENPVESKKAEKPQVKLLPIAERRELRVTTMKRYNAARKALRVKGNTAEQIAALRAEIKACGLVYVEQKLVEFSTRRRVAAAE